MDDCQDDGKWDDKEEAGTNVHHKKNNILPLWGNERTMNLNPLILTNIQSSHYFKVNLYELKTYHEVIDEIYYNVTHLEPWEKGSRKTAGQTGMCGGVRGVGAGGIVSTAFCLLYKLFTLKLTRKQVIGLITHPDSPYIRVLGFMYIRYTQPPADLWDWYEPYLDDTLEVDVKAGGGQFMTIGNILKNFLCKLEWFSTLFPRIPVPIQQKLEKKMNEKYPPSAQAAVVPAAGRRLGSTSRAESRSRPSPDEEGYARNRDRSKYSSSRDSAAAALRDDRKNSGRLSSHRSSSRDRYRGERREPRSSSPYARNGYRSSSRDDRERDRYRYEERERHRSSEKDRRHRHHAEEYTREERYRKSDYEKRYADSYRDERKYKDEYIHEKSHRRSYTPERKRSHHKEGKSASKYRDDDYEYRKSDRRQSSEERNRYDDEAVNIKRSKYY